MLVEERNVAIDLLAEADAMIEDLQDQLMLVRQKLTEVHETLDSQYCNKGGKLDDESNRHARRKVLVARQLRQHRAKSKGFVFAR